MQHETSSSWRLMAVMRESVSSLVSLMIVMVEMEIVVLFILWSLLQQIIIVLQTVNEQEQEYARQTREDSNDIDMPCECCKG